MITFEEAAPEDAQELLALQRKAFLPLLEVYQDGEASPANWSLEKMRRWIEEKERIFLKVMSDGRLVGAIRSRPSGEPGIRYLQAVFIDPDEQGRGFAQLAIMELERRCPEASGWLLEVPEAEDKNRHVYEKMGYRNTGERIRINERLNLLVYRK